MKNILMPFLEFILLSLAACAGQSKYLQLGDIIPLPDVKGRIDHMAIDLKKQRLFVAALANNTLEVIDLAKHTRIYTIQDLDQPQGVLYIPKNNTLCVSNGSSGKCDIFDAESFKLLRSLQLGDDADNMRYDPNTSLIYVGYGTGAIGIMDHDAVKKTAAIALPGHPEAFELEKNGAKLFVNIPATKQVAVIDRQNRSLSKMIDLKDAGENFPMALDETNHRLFVGCRRPARLIVLDTQSETEIYHLDMDQDADDIFWDTAGKRMYISCGSGFIDIIRQVNADEYAMAERFPTEPGARTSFFVPGSGVIYLAVPAQGGRPAKLHVYKIL